MDLPRAFALFLLLGIAQGLFLALLLLSRRENAAANRILAGTMAAFALFLAESALYVQGDYRTFPFLIGISQPVVFLFGPAIWLYARTIGGSVEARRPRTALHFLPAVAVAIYFLPFYLQPGPAKASFVTNLMRDGAPLDVEIIEWLKLPHGAIYTLATFGVLGQYRRRLQDSFSTLDRINLNWLRNILLGTMVVWIAAIVSSGLGLLGVRVLAGGLSFAPLVLVVFVYTIGILGLRQPEVFWPPTAPADDAEPTSALPPDAGGGKYRKSGLEPARAAGIEQTLLDVMQDDRPQEDPDLTLQQLAERLDVSAHNLSEVINGRLGTNFHDFVNGYRVEEAKRRLRDPKLTHHTIFAVALDSGFRSKSTFNKIFKQFTGVTPSAYRRDQAPA